MVEPIRNESASAVLLSRFIIRFPFDPWQSGEQADRVRRKKSSSLRPQAAQLLPSPWTLQKTFLQDAGARTAARLRGERKECIYTSAPALHDRRALSLPAREAGDRKSTRLNSSH